MTSRFSPSFPVLNGPHGGDRIEAPPGIQAGAGVAVGWSGPKGVQYAVYVLVQIPDELAKPASDEPAGPALGDGATVPQPKLGLAFMRSWPTPKEAQQHVQEISLVTRVAREVAQSN